MRYYEHENDALFPLAEHKSTDPQRGMSFLPRRALNVSECEIARAYKIYGAAVEPIAFIVPRKVSCCQSVVAKLTIAPGGLLPIGHLPARSVRRASTDGV